MGEIGEKEGHVMCPSCFLFALFAALFLTRTSTALKNLNHNGTSLNI